jgi:hypothetical protein
MTENEKLTRAEEKEVIRDVIIDWMDNNGKNDMIEFIVNQLNGKQRKDILQLMCNEYNRELTQSKIALGFIIEE